MPKLVEPAKRLRWKPHGPGGRVIVKRDADATVINGIHIPNAWQRHDVLGTVVRVHDGAPQRDGSLRACEVAPGDRVIFGKYSGSDVELDGETYTIMPEDELLAVVE